MDNSRVLILNVNPAEATMGSLHPEAAINRMRRKMDLEGASLARKKSGGMLRAFFGSTSLSPARSGMLLTLRVLFGAFMVYFGYMSLEGSVILAVASALFGLLLVAGFLTRFSMIASALTFGILSGMAFEAGQMPETTLLIAVMSIGMAFIGPGRYSADALLRRRIFRSIRRYETRKLMERRFSYRAYQYSHLF
ncbi:MAG: DoxX family protein [Bacteroidales bacterium]|nr:DoxX family protein [Bacteroidales bacterium]